MLRFLLLVMWFPIFAFAQSSNAVNAQLKVKINPYASCTSYLSSARVGISDNELNFGNVRPDQIRNAPSPVGLTEQILMNTSNINGMYDVRMPTHTLNFVCEGMPNLNSVTGSFKIDILHGRPIVAGSGLELINNATLNTLWNEIGVLLYLKDRNSRDPLRTDAASRYGSAPTLRPDSFKLVNGKYVANIDIYLGLYWISTTSRDFTPEELTFPMTFRVWYL